MYCLEDLQTTLRPEPEKELGRSQCGVDMGTNPTQGRSAGEWQAKSQNYSGGRGTEDTRVSWNGRGTRKREHGWQIRISFLNFGKPRVSFLLPAFYGKKP